MTEKTQNLRISVLFMLVAYLASSLMAATVKHLGEDISVHLIVAVQNIVCLLPFLPGLFTRSPVLYGSSRKQLLLLRGVTGWAGASLFYYSLTKIPLVDGVLLRNSAPLWVPIVLWCWLGLVVPRHRWIPLIVGFVGIMLVLGPTGSNFQLGHLFGLASGIMMSVSMTAVRLLVSTEPNNRIMLYTFGMGALCSLPFALFELDSLTLSSLPFLLILALFFYFANVFVTKALSGAKASIIAPISYFGVVFSGLLGWLLWGHVPSLLSFTGMLLVILAGISTVFFARESQ